MRVLFVSLFCSLTAFTLIGCKNPSGGGGSDLSETQSSSDFTITLSGEADADQNIMLSWSTDKTPPSGGSWSVEIRNPDNSSRSVTPPKDGTYTVPKPSVMGSYRYHVRYGHPDGSEVVSNSIIAVYTGSRAPVIAPGPKIIPSGSGITLSAGPPDTEQRILLSWNTDKVPASGGSWFVEIINPNGSLRSVSPEASGRYTAVKPAVPGSYRYRVRYQAPGGLNVVSNSVSVSYSPGAPPGINPQEKNIENSFRNTGTMNPNTGRGGFEDLITASNKFPSPLPPGDRSASPGFDLVAYWGDWSTWQHRLFDIEDIPQGAVSSIAYAFFKITDGRSINLPNVGRSGVTPPWGAVLPADDGSAFSGSGGRTVTLWPGDAGGTISWGKGNLNTLKNYSSWADTALSVGGWTLSAAFQPLAADAVAKRAGTAGAGGKVDMFVRSVIMYLERYEFKTVDLDWEFPENSAHRRGFKDLVHYLRTELDAKWSGAARKDISIAITGNPMKMRFVPLDDAEFMNNVDRVKIMTYDLAGAYGPMTGHHTNLFGDAFHGKSVEAGKTRDYGVDAAVRAAAEMMGRADSAKLNEYKKKIRIGVAYYGRGWAKVDAPAGWRPAQNADPAPLIGINVPKTADLSDGSTTYGFAGSFGQYGTINYPHIRRYFLDYVKESPRPYSGKNGFYRLWDDKAKAPMLYSPSHKVLITYDDNESIAAKVKYAHENGLGGVIVWMISEDYNGELTAAINREAKKYSW